MNLKSCNITQEIAARIITCLLLITSSEASLRATSNETVADGIFLKSSTSLNSKAPAYYDVIIIGAGWSGVAAAVSLKSKGMSNYKILEARDRIGGRSRTETESWEGVDIPFDLGSQWIHGTINSPVFDAVEKYKIPYSISPGVTTFYQGNNKGAYGSDFIWNLYAELLEDFKIYQSVKQCNTDYDDNLRNMVNQYVKEKSLNVWKTDVLEMFLRTSIKQSYATSLDNLSLWYWDSWGVDFWDTEVFLHEGYSAVFEAHASPVKSKIETQAVVTLINYKKGKVKVKYTDADGTKKTIRAKKVLVTVPLGVLKTKAIKFRPKLPKNHRNSIKQLGMGTLNKIHMIWNKNDIFWPSKVQWFSEVTRRDSPFEFYNPHSFNGGLPLLSGFVAGDDAEYLERKYGNDQSWYEWEMTVRAMLALRNMFGKNIPNPEKVYVTKWRTDPYSRGSYSYNKVNMHKDARTRLSETVNNRIYFAGEATHKDYHSTTHGAYLSGVDAAVKIAG